MTASCTHFRYTELLTWPMWSMSAGSIAIGWRNVVMQPAGSHSLTILSIRSAAGWLEVEAECHEAVKLGRSAAVAEPRTGRGEDPERLRELYDRADTKAGRGATADFVGSLPIGLDADEQIVRYFSR